MKKMINIIFILLFGILLVGCNQITTNLTNTTDTSTKITSDSEVYVNDSIYHIYQLAVEVNATTESYEEWLESVKGPQGEPGKSINLQISGGYIQWQYTGDTAWTNLISLETLIGAAGQDGLSAYEIYLINYPDYTGTETDWINDLMNGNLADTRSCTVTFMSDDIIQSTQMIECGYRLVKPDEPTKDGYNFDGWYIDNEKWVFIGFSVVEDITLHARWEPKQFTVTFDPGLGTMDNYQEVYLYDSEAKFPVPTLQDKIFYGWYYGDELVESGLWKIDSDVTLIAFWVDSKYSITLDVNGGQITGSTNFEVSYGETYTLPIPTSEVAPFSGWYLDGIRYTDEFGVMLSEYNELNNITLVAYFIIEISTVDDLILINNNLSANYILVNDIDLMGYEWIPIGDVSSPYKGNFYGNGYSINNLTIRNSYNYVGLFGVVSGSIYDLTLNDVSINMQGVIGENTYVGSVFGTHVGTGKTISNLNISGEIIVKGRSGLILYAGGIAGSINNTTVLNNLYLNIEFDSSLSLGTTYSGGISGYILGSTISNCIVEGSITGLMYTGGIIGRQDGYTEIRYTTNNAIINGISSTGGIIGYGERLRIENVINNGTITAQTSLGGLIGYGDYPYITIINSSNNGDIVSIAPNNYASVAGGLIGCTYSGERIYISNSNNRGNVTSPTCYVGGFIGYIDDTDELVIIDSYNDGDITGSIIIGGFVGHLYKSTNVTFERNVNFGNISGIDLIGGFVGEGAYTRAIFTENSNEGVIIGNNNVGGFAGSVRNSSIGIGMSFTDCINTGDISAVGTAGGFIGNSESSTITINNSFSGGNLTGEYIGGFIGISNTNAINNSISLYIQLIYSQVDGDYANNYYLYSETDIYGTQINISQVNDSSFYLDDLNWLSTIWSLDIISIEDGQLPVLVSIAKNSEVQD